VNRADRLRKIIPDAPDAMIGALATMPAAEVDRWLPALRQAKRAGRVHEAGLRRQRKADSAKFRWYDEDQLRAAVVRRIGSTGKRASADLAALESLAKFVRYSGFMIEMAVASLRAQNVSDDEIGQALGVTRQAVGQRFGRKRGFTDEAVS
jgi:hypothetical protein